MIDHPHDWAIAQRLPNVAERWQRAGEAIESPTHPDALPQFCLALEAEFNIPAKTWLQRYHDYYEYRMNYLSAFYAIHGVMK